MPVAPLHQPEGMTTQVRLACGPGRTRVNGVCVAEPPSAIHGAIVGVCDGLEALALGGVITETRPKGSVS
jgi:hypothetical protein